MSNIKRIKSFKDLAIEKESTKYKILLAEKQIKLKTLEIKHQFEPAKMIGSMVNKLLESFFNT
ncbi:MAG: hypothetical protein JW717_01530 [Marinilabiliaceae bacterium]|nr:hypothetical protein [Marinilabiliaceae bacterium]